MATPRGHALAGRALYGCSRTLKARPYLGLGLFCAFMAVAPDLDKIPGLKVGRPVLFHQGISHSLGVAVAISLGIAGIHKLRGQAFILVFSICFFSYSSHLLMDWLGPDRRPPLRIPAFWPASEESLISPMTLFLSLRHVAETSATTADWTGSIVSSYNFGAIVVEVAGVTPFLLLGHWTRKPGEEALVPELLERNT